MNDFTGREVQVGHILAVSPARDAYLYAATVIAIETYNGQTRQVEDRSFAILTVRLHSNSRKQKLDEWDGYPQRVVITGEEASSLGRKPQKRAPSSGRNSLVGGRPHCAARL